MNPARKAESLIPFWDVEPRLDLLGNRESDETYLAAKPGERYLLYFTDGGSATLTLPPGMFELRWVSVQTGNGGATAELSGGAAVSAAATAV